MEKQETFKSVQHVTLDTTFGTIKEQEDVELEVTVGVDGDRGWFEVYDTETGGEEWYAEGGLWFSGKKLVDYDGTFSLLNPVEDKLKEWGYDTKM